MSNSPDDEHKKKCHTIINKDGLHLFGYTVSWWIILLVVLIVVYVLYDKELMEEFNGSSISGPTVSSKQNLIPDVKEVTPASVSSLFRFNNVETPQGLRDLYY